LQDVSDVLYIGGRVIHDQDARHFVLPPGHRALNARRVSNSLQLYTRRFAGSRENLASAPETPREPAAEFAAFEGAVAACAAQGGGLESPPSLGVDQDHVGLCADRK